MDIIEILKVILVGIIEGVTEWLPVSSTGHMYLMDAFLPLSMSEEFKNLFMVVIQLGAIMAVVVCFWGKLFPWKKQENKIVWKQDSLHMWLMVIVACVPTAIIGFLLDDFLEEHLYNTLTIALMLILYGVAFIAVEKWNKTRTAKVTSIDQIDVKKGVAFGLFQCLAMIPGTSRSGATIVGGLAMGVDRSTAAEFTFFLAIPTMFGASLLKVVKYVLKVGLVFESSEILSLILGMGVAFAVSMASIKFLMSFVRKHDFSVFGWYRIVVGVIILALFAFQVI